MRSLLSFIPRLWANWITLTGSILTTASGVAILVFMIFEGLGNPYGAGMLVIASLTLFIAGLLLIPFGLWIDRRRRKKAGIPDGENRDLIMDAFEAAMRDRRMRNRVAFVLVMTLVNIVLFAGAGKASVEYADSPKFCGATCHTPMQPEWETYNRSPHAKVACVQCHIGEGTIPFIKAKWNGMHQLAGVVANDYHRPVPTPVTKMRPADETCGNCHWPERWINNKLKVFPHYKADKDNTPAYNAEFLHVGGRNPATGKFEGIHSHSNPDKVIQYEYADELRRKVGKITVLEKGVVTAVYEPKGEAPKAIGTRRMDCIDCHSRPTHIEEPSAAHAVDRALSDGRLDPKLPFIKQVATEVLAKDDVKHADAEAYFKKAVAEAYAKHADVQVPAEAQEKAALALAQLYTHNVYPDMQVGWGTYRNNLMHEVEGDDAAGCFRCHDGERKAKLSDGSTKLLSQDCSVCHEQVANEDDPAKFDATLKAAFSKGE